MRDAGTTSEGKPMKHVRRMMTVIALSVAAGSSAVTAAEPQLDPRALAFKLPAWPPPSRPGMATRFETRTSRANISPPAFSGRSRKRHRIEIKRVGERPRAAAKFWGIWAL